jgi:hypothetical protein
LSSPKKPVTVTPPPAPKRTTVTEIYTKINELYPLNNPAMDAMREKAYAEVVDIELDKFIEALTRANEKNIDLATFMGTLYAQGKLQDLFAMLFMAAHPQHRIKISYLYDQMNLLFRRATAQAQAQAEKR